MRTTIHALLQREEPLEDVEVAGWVRTRRASKTFSFVELNDGSCLQSVQIIADGDLDSYGEVEKLSTGASAAVKGKLVPSQGKNQRWEILAQEVRLLGECPEDYPLQKKGHSREFLRTIAHLRPRTNFFGAVFRLRSRLAYAIHQFFHDRGFLYVHTPIITANDCEGAGEMFRVTTLDPRATTPQKDEEDFFAGPTYLTVSGQLAGESFACALSNIYTFGPTFRAENSHTSRHASEFWMIEPEMAFCDLQGDVELAEEMVRYLVEDSLNHCEADLAFFSKWVDKSLLQRLGNVLDHPFERLAYTEAVEILTGAKSNFEYPVEYGLNLQSEHERFLTETYFKTPVTVCHFPREIKPFYMRLNDDGKTVAAMDLLVPGIGELVGGSQREERLSVLEANMKAHALSMEDYWWYGDLRKYGSVPHAGFGLGFERLIMFITGVSNIRDVIPFPRTPGSAEF